MSASRPDIYDEVCRYQPHLSSYLWMKHLVELCNENKHRHLTPQTRLERRAVRLGDPLRGVIEFTPFDPGKGGVQFIGNVAFGGRPVDDCTFKPLDGGPPAHQEIVYVGWLFAYRGLPVLSTLKAIHWKLRPVIQSVCDVAGI